MSEDPSTTSKDPNKVSKKKNSGTNADFKQQPRKGSKDYQVYFEAKGSEKPSKDQYNTRKASTHSTNLDEHQAPKNPNKQKSHAKNRKESRDQAWKKKYPRVSKELIIEFYLKAPAYADIDELVSTCSQLFVKEKLIPVNNEDNNLDPNEGLILKTNYPPTTHNAAQGHSNHAAHEKTHAPVNQPSDVTPTKTENVNTNNVTNTTTNAPTTGFVRSTMPAAASSAKPTELSEAPVNLNDPIQAMRERMKRDKARKEAAQKAENEGKAKEENAGDVRKESQEEARVNTEEKENKNINSQEVPAQTQKESLKEDNTKTVLEDSQAEKERKGSQTETRDSGVDFSKLSLESENKGNLSDEFNSQQADANAQQRAYQENANYNNQDMSRGAQVQQINTQYANKGDMPEQASPTMRRDSPGSYTNIPKALPPNIVFKYFSPNYDEKVWSYVDLEEKLQGPFSGRAMDDWFSKGYLPLELNVTIGKGNGFKLLKDLVEIIMNHNTQAQAESPIAKTQTPPKMQAQDYQYQQQQQQQQHQQQQQQYYQQQQQQQQQYPQQYQQQQQTQQQRQYQQYQQQQQQYPQQQAQYSQQQKQYYQQQQQQQHQDPRYQEYAQYGSTTPTTSANRNKAMEGFDSYYGSQGGSTQYGSQGNVIYGKVQEIDPQSQTYYSNTQYYNQESTPKSGAGYGNYKQGANMNQNQNAYYQDSNTYGGYNQQAYNQPQKQQVKANYPTQMQQQQNYPTGGNQMGSYGGNYGGQSQARDYSNYGGNNAQMYSMQQQQQMMNKGAGMGGGNMGNAGMPSDMTMHLKNMLGVARPSSRQEGHEY